MQCNDAESKVAQREAYFHSKEIDKLLEEEALKSREKPPIKILLLGTSDAGKSTILKQLKIIYGRDYTSEERHQYRPILIANVVQCAKSLIAAMKDLEISYCTPGIADEHVKFIEAAPDNYTVDSKVDPAVAKAIKMIWADAGVQSCFARAREFKILDSCPSLMEKVDAICSPGYLPPNEGILMSRMVTTTIQETNLEMNNAPVKIYDVCGQRKRRSAWTAYFDDCRAIIFLAAISSYDQTMDEEPDTNRLIDSIMVFDNICNHVLFKETPVILFLNKTDLLKKKLPNSPVRNHFPAYSGKNDFGDVAEYFRGLFVAKNKEPNKELYTHFTWATDTNQTKKILSSVFVALLTVNLKAANFL